MLAILRLLAAIVSILPDKFALILAHLWSIKDQLPENPTSLFLVTVTHGWRRYSPTNGYEAVTGMAWNIKNKYTNAICLSGWFSGSPAESGEKDFRINLGFKPLGSVTATIDEAAGARKYIPADFEEAIIVVTDEAHSRRCKMIWKIFFPKAQVLVIAVPLSSTIDPQSPMETYHTTWKALVFQTVPTPLYWWWGRKGPEYLASKAQFHQPIVRS